MTSEELKKELKILSKEMEKNQLLSYELSGYMKDSVGRKIFRESAKHHIRPRKKYMAIDQETSGKFLVQKEQDKIAQAGYVWGIKAYGQKGRAVGNIKKVIEDFKRGNETMQKAVMKKAIKNRLKFK